MNELSVLEDCPVWILFAEYDERFVRARLRSKGPAIDKLANQYKVGAIRWLAGQILGPGRKPMR
ncbi:MAG: hypothetical protein PHP61_02455 [Candidatus Izemoplasmatales bacterium]|nr:hypothetical protein [Candidatus Izemoplasmatales bacterium]